MNRKVNNKFRGKETERKRKGNGRNGKGTAWNRKWKGNGRETEKKRKGNVLTLKRFLLFKLAYILNLDSLNNNKNIIIEKKINIGSARIEKIVILNAKNVILKVKMTISNISGD